MELGLKIGPKIGPILGASQGPGRALGGPWEGPPGGQIQGYGRLGAYITLPRRALRRALWGPAGAPILGLFQRPISQGSHGETPLGLALF